MGGIGIVICFFSNQIFHFHPKFDFVANPFCINFLHFDFTSIYIQETTEQSERMEAEIEKARLKLEKKRLKAEVKARKKGKS